MPIVIGDAIFFLISYTHRNCTRVSGQIFIQAKFIRCVLKFAVEVNFASYYS